MKRVKGTVSGQTVLLRESVDVPPDTEVEVLIPEPGDQSLAGILARVRQHPPAEVLSDEEIVEIVHQVRARRRESAA